MSMKKQFVILGTGVCLCLGTSIACSITEDCWGDAETCNPYEISKAPASKECCGKPPEINVLKNKTFRTKFVTNTSQIGEYLCPQEKGVASLGQSNLDLVDSEWQVIIRSVKFQC